MYEGPLNRKLFDALGEAIGREARLVLKIKIALQDPKPRVASNCSITVRKDEALTLENRLLGDKGLITHAGTERLAQEIETGNSSAETTLSLVVTEAPLTFGLVKHVAQT